MNRLLNIFLHRRLHRREYLLRLGIIGAYLLMLTAILPSAAHREYEYLVTKAWDYPDLHAPFSFYLRRPPQEVNAERVTAAAQVLHVFRPDSGAYQRTRRNVVRELDSLLPNHTPQAQLAAQHILQQVYQQGYIRMPRDSFQQQHFLAIREREGVERVVALEDVYSPQTIATAIEPSLQILPANERDVLRHLIARLLEPSLRYDYNHTEKVREEQSRLVSPIAGHIAENSLIVKHGQAVTPEIDAVLRSLERAKGKKLDGDYRWTLFLRQLLLVMLISMVLWLYLGVHRKEIYYDLPKFTLVLTVMLIVLVAMRLSLMLTRFMDADLHLSPIYLVPACLVPIIITNFFDERTGAMCNMTMALYGGVLLQSSLEFVLMQIIVGIVTVYSLRRLRQRRVFFFTLFYMLGAYIVTYLAFSWYAKGDFTEINYSNLVLFLFNMVMTIMAYPLIYGLERMFGVTSDLTYLELLDTNHPLLQELLRRAPGTFQHSVQVANIAEAAANAINANALLAHVGALYHDVGKMKNPQYFIENAIDEDTPHDLLPPEESAAIILGHVTKGISLAEKYNMPKGIIEFIRTHHGTTRVEYFYRNYLKQHGLKEPQADAMFRYAGPRPYTKETAVLMLSDSIEAASHALKSPTPEELRQLVDSIVDGKIRNGQLDNAPITFRDVTNIRKVIYKQLVSIYHGRIEYPEEVK